MAQAVPPPVQQKLHMRRQARIDHRQVATKMRVQVIMQVIAQMIAQVIVQVRGVLTIGVVAMIATVVAVTLGAVTATIAIVPGALHPAVSLVST
jgi:uncharacterized membrane protein